MHTPVKVGNYVNFTVQQIVTEPSGVRLYVQKKYSGKVISIAERDMSQSYKIKIHKQDEYHEVRRFKITHVWYIV